MKTRWIAVGILAWQVSPVWAQQAPRIEEIKLADLKADLYFLASDEMAGRLTDTPENRLAAQFVKTRFESLGLEPVEGSYFQSFTLTVAQLGSKNRLEVRRGDHLSLEKRLLSDFFPQSFSATAWAEGELVFAGFGIEAPAFSHSDYRADVRGKIVLVLQHEPGEDNPESPFDGLVTSEASREHRKALWAQQKGAIGILFVTDIHNHPQGAGFERQASGAWPASPRRIPRFSLASWVEQVQIPALSISPELAELLVSGSGRSLQELSQQAEKQGGLAPVPLPGLSLKIQTDVVQTRIPDRNVVALLKGSDPQLRDELVILSAHYDHDGADGNQVFNGADDDGSGTVALMALAKAYAAAAQAGQRPRRSILFACWNSEERGLLGAWAYTEKPLFPLRQTAAVLNMDMLGRNEEVPEGGSRRFNGLQPQTAESNRNAINIMGYSFNRDLQAMAEKANSGIDLTLRFRYDNNPSNLLRRSDHWPFLQKGVPALFFHTGLHPDYHTSNDRPERINYPKMEKIVRLIYQLSWDVANREGRIDLERPVIEAPTHSRER